MLMAVCSESFLTQTAGTSDAVGSSFASRGLPLRTTEQLTSLHLGYPIVSVDANSSAN